MKKLISFIAAATVAMTSFSTIASAAYIDDKDVDVKLDISTKWGGDYADHETESKAQTVIINTNTEFDSKAVLDMSEVAKTWHDMKELEVASTYAAKYPDNEYAIAEAVKLSGEYTLKITRSDGVITNDAIVKDGALQDLSSVLNWAENAAGYKATDFFEYKSAELSEDNKTLTVVYKIQDKTKELNDKFDDYFEGLYAADNDETKNGGDYDFVLNIDSSTINPTASGTYYNVKGEFSGYVDIEHEALQVAIGRINFPLTSDIEYMQSATAAPSSTPSSTTSPSRGRSGGGGSRATATPTAAVISTPTAEATTAPTATPVPEDKIQNVTNSRGATLNTDDHYAYIIGYPLEDNETLAEVRPEASITRAEVATIFFRLLTNESRAEFWSQDNSFSDVEKADWFNNAISTAQNAGIIEGSDGLFRPDDAITRAEFATIAARFSSVVYDGDDKFSDISSHWARESINKAAETGWINGYDDGTFGPDKNITRAEAMTLINRMLYRLVENGGLKEEGMLTWIDNLDKTAWYYANVQEATNSHNYSRTAVGYVENWTETAASPDWEALEKEWSEVTDAGTEESIFEDSGLEELNSEQNAADVEAADVEAADDAATTDKTSDEATAAEETETVVDDTPEETPEE